MKPIDSIFSAQITEALGWTIIHAIWQGFIVLLGLTLLLIALKKYSSQIRYFVTFTSLIIMLGWSVSTFMNAYSYANEKQKLRSEILTKPDFIRNLANLQNTNPDNYTINSWNTNIKIVKVRSWFQRNFPIILSIWLIGIALFTVRLLGGLAYNKRLKTLQLLPFEEVWMNKLKEFTNQLNITKNVKAYKSPHTHNPITFGFFKPVILFPVKAFTGLSDKEIEAVIAHELAHIVRNDYFFNIIQSIIEIIFFYHPAVWIISERIKEEREHCCDDIAINLTGDKITYAKALTQSQIFSFQNENLTLAFGRKKGSLLERIKRIQKQRVMKTNITEKIIASIIIISSIFLVSFSVGNQFANSNIPISETFTAKKDTIVSPKKIKTIVKIERDSILNEVEKNLAETAEKEKISKEVKQIIEIALSENDKALSTEIIKEINLSLKEINIDKILQDARIEVEAAMDDINMDSINLEIKVELKEAQEEIRKEMEELKKEMDSAECFGIPEISLQAAESGLHIASEILENLDIEDIVKTSLEAANIAIELAGDEINKANIDSIIEAEMKNVEIEKKSFNIETEELKDEIKALKKEMKKLKKELNQASKNK